MTLPGSGPISYNDVNNVMGRGSGANIDMGFIYNNTKSGQQSYALSNYYSKAWYLKNNDGNCNNGNCACNCNCFGWDFPANCANCLNCTNVNCVNCDSRNWLQNNCNCACTYNCNITGAWQTNCNCNCDCVCACCFPGDALVTMADGTLKRIDEIKIGDLVVGGHGFINKIKAIHRAPLSNNTMYLINKKYRATKEHKLLTTEGWAVAEPAIGKTRTMILLDVDNNGTKELRRNYKLNKIPTLKLEVGMSLVTTDGEELIESIEIDHSFSRADLVYNLVADGSHTHLISGNLIVSAWATDIDFNYETWTQHEEDLYDDTTFAGIDFFASLYMPTSRGEAARQN